MESSSGPAAGLWVVGDTAVDGHLTLTVTGDLTCVTAEAAHVQLTALLDRSSAPVVRMDLARLRFCDLTGLRTLLEVAARAAAAGRQVRTVAASLELECLLTVTETAPLLGYQPAAVSLGP